MTEKDQAEVTALATTQGDIPKEKKLVSELAESEFAVLRTTIAKGATNEEFAVYVATCRHLNLNPFTGQIHFVKYGGQMVTVVGIYGILKLAEMGGTYNGRTPYYWLTENGEWVEEWIDKGNPVAAKVGVYRKGNTIPVISVATWQSYAKDTNPLWKSMPDRMLGKCAFAQALREACPDIGGVYIAEEFGTSIEDLKQNPNQQTPRGAANHVATVAGFTPDDLCPIGKDWKGKPWSAVEPSFLEWIIDKINDKPDIVARAKWEQDLRAGDIPIHVDQNGEIKEADFEDAPPDIEFLRNKIEAMRKSAPKTEVDHIIANYGDPTLVSDPVLLNNIATEIQKVMKESGS